MLLKWEGVTKRLFHFGKMNQWVYDGFVTTYKNLGVDFDCFTMKARPIY
jgi:arginyl-tRNA synthetase